MLKNILLVALGGAIGSSLRYFLGTKLSGLNVFHFPFATAIINILGCFAFGFIMGYTSKNDVFGITKPLLLIGLCGGFTTFSAFAWENFTLLQQQQYFKSFVYILSSVVCSVSAVFAGLYIFNKNN